MSGSFENVGWSRPGGECWYNVDIMSELCSILSFGAGGSTKMVEPGTNHIERIMIMGMVNTRRLPQPSSAFRSSWWV